MRKKKAKRVHFELIERGLPIGVGMYDLLDELIDLHHEDLRQARFALAWNSGWRPDVDGNLVTVRVVKATDLQRELRPDVDFIIVVNRVWWYDDRVEHVHRRERLDFALCSCAPILDKAGDYTEDERDRKLWRTRKPAYQGFPELIERYGLEATLRGQEVAAAILRSPAKFQACEDCQDDQAGPGWNTVGDTVKRCACFKTFTQIAAERAEAVAP